MNSLDEIATKYGTDKACTHPQCSHGYTPHYERFFSPLRDMRIKFLEIGVGGGESIKTWLEYFPNGQIFGVDRVEGTNAYNTVGSGIDPRYVFVHGDQTDSVLWKCFAVNYGTEFDMIIDDGSHCSDGVITAFTGLWPIVRSGGYYCIEDLGVTYGEGSVFLRTGYQNHMDFVKDKLDEINLKQSISFLFFAKELAIFCKL